MMKVVDEYLKEGSNGGMQCTVSLVSRKETTDVILMV